MTTPREVTDEKDRTRVQCAGCHKMMLYLDAQVTSAPWKFYHPTCLEEAQREQRQNSE